MGVSQSRPSPELTSGIHPPVVDNAPNTTATMRDGPPPRYRVTNEHDVENITTLLDNIQNVTVLDLHQEEQRAMLRNALKELHKLKHGVRKLEATAKLAQEAQEWKELYEKTCRQHQPQRLEYTDLTNAITLAVVVTLLVMYFMGIIPAAQPSGGTEVTVAIIYAVLSTVIVLFCTGTIQRAHRLDFVDLAGAILYAMGATVWVFIFSSAYMKASADGWSTSMDPLDKL